MRATGCFFLCFLAARAFAQYDVAVSGEYASVHLPLDAHYALEWTGFEPPRVAAEVFTTVAAAPGGRVIAADRSGAIYEITPDGRREIARQGAFVFGMAVSRAGTIYAIVGGWSPDDIETLIAVENGSIRIVGPIPFRHRAFAHLPPMAIDLAADQCTLLYPKNYVTVGRYDVCTANPLSDFPIDVPSGGSAVSGVRILPDGGSLVAVGPTIRRLNAQGVQTRAYVSPVAAEYMRGLAIGRDGRTFLVGVYAPRPNAQVLELDLESGALVRVRGLTFVERTGTIVIANGWSAAFDSHLAADVPTLDVLALALFAALLTLVAARRV